MIFTAFWHEKRYQKIRNEAVDAMYQNSAEISHRALPPAEKLFASDHAAVRIIPQTIKMAIYARPDFEGDDLYETLLFDESSRAI